METHKFGKNSHISQESLFSGKNIFFQLLEIGIFRKTPMKTAFLRNYSHLAYEQVTWSFFNVLEPPRQTSYVDAL